MGIKTGTVKVLELAVASLIGAVAAKLFDVLLSSSLTGVSLISYSFLAAGALLGYSALGLAFIYGLDKFYEKYEKKKEVV